MASVSVEQMKEAMTNLLNSREQGEFIDTLNDFHSKRNIDDFAHALKNLLDTPAKMHLATMVRSVLPTSDIGAFDEIMATSFETNSLPRLPKGNLYRAASSPNIGIPTGYYQTVPTRGAKSIRRSVPQNLHKLGQFPYTDAGNIGEIKTIQLDPPSSSAGLGFSIRGGAEHGIGIYVSYVDVESVAEKAGVIPGDQILGVNGHSFLKISHADAAKVSPCCSMIIAHVIRSSPGRRSD